MSELGRKVVTVEVQVRVSVCDICGIEEAATCYGFEDENRGVGLPPKLVAHSYNFETHGEVRAACRMTSRTWTFCRAHLVAMSGKLEAIITEMKRG